MLDPRRVLFAECRGYVALQQVFEGVRLCEVSWTLFDLSLTEWSLLFFVSMMILAVYQSLRLVWIGYQRPLSASRRTGPLRAIKHLYELYLLRTLKPVSCGHNLARTCHWNYVAR